VISDDGQSLFEELVIEIASSDSLMHR
jgi:hypothetical protein